MEHLKSFEETLKRKILDKKDENKLSLIEKHYLLQLTEAKSDDDTEVEEEVLDVVPHLCSILLCDDIIVPSDEQTLHYFNQYGYKLEYPNLDKYEVSSTLIHCAYCMLDSGKNQKLNNIEDIWVHCVSSHPNYPILAYDLSLVKKSFDNKNVDGGVSMDIKTKMKKFAQTSTPGIVSISQQHNLTVDNVDDSLISNIVSTFRQQLSKCSLSKALSMF